MRKSAQNLYLKAMRKRIREVYWKGTRLNNKKPGPALGEQLHRTIARHKGGRHRLPSDVEIWLVIFDEIIGFWFLTWSIYQDRALKEKRPVSDRSICLATLAARILQDMICVRELVESGFFVQGNVVTRSLIEAIDLMHLLNMRPDLSAEFRAVETNEQASSFWHKHCSRNKIHRQIKVRWRWFLERESDEVVGSFHDRREDYLDIVGMSVHPSFSASFSSFMDRPIGERSKNLFKAVLGSVSHMSKFTIHLILLRVFEYGILWVGPEANLYKGNKPTKKFLEKELKKSLRLIFSLVVAVDERPDPDPLFPEFKTFWVKQA